ncbi:DUF6318 family protein [Demequina gelatinilytica]|uniref:DUF6318 family protein n=1 Tax=Demequina gelatinilytica TaxID=1638980 RepID=UPI000782D82B|nr:DUF6318 family protein [Demequina gelatinilytica]
MLMALARFRAVIPQMCDQVFCQGGLTVTVCFMRIGGLVAAAGVLLLSGCFGEPGPIVSETPSVAGTVAAAVSPTPTPSASAVSEALTDEELTALLPERALIPDVRGAMATAEFFLEQYAPMFHTGDTRVWEALSAEGCEYCASALENAERVRDEGWTARGGQIAVVRNTQDGALTSPTTAYYSIEADREAAFLAPAEGPETRSAKASRTHFEFALELVDDRWLVAGVTSELVSES